MPLAVQIARPGGPEEMKLVDLPVGDPGPGQVRIRHHAIGLNFIDVYQRTGLYPLPMPLTLGMEGAGVVEAVGEGVTHLKPGDRAAYAGNPPGSYSQVRVMPALTVCRLPDDIGFDTAAAMMLKGLTAQYLLRRTLPCRRPAAGRPRAVACRRRRRRPDRLPVGQGLGLSPHRHRRFREKCALALANGAQQLSITERKTLPSASPRSPTARA
jgi:NADPH2:quinone reductase